jgi:hypothetical protein
MDKKLEEKLLHDFPDIFSSDEDCPFFHYRFECGSGWYPLLYRAATALHLLLRDNKGTIKTQQVKEKFGHLCFYIDGPVWAQQMIESAERDSQSTCELCGKPGVTIVINDFYKTLCPVCSAQASAGEEGNLNTKGDSKPH